MLHPYRCYFLSFFPVENFLASRVSFFFRRPPPAPESTNGPDQFWTGSLEYVKDVELNGTSGGTRAGSMWCEAPKGTPSAPSWCGGGNFSLLLFAFAWLIRRRRCLKKHNTNQWTNLRSSHYKIKRTCKLKVGFSSTKVYNQERSKARMVKYKFMKLPARISSLFGNSNSSAIALCLTGYTDSNWVLMVPKEELSEVAYWI